MAGEALREKLEAADARRAALEAEEEAKVRALNARVGDAQRKREEAAASGGPQTLREKALQEKLDSAVGPTLFFSFFLLSRLELSDTNVYEPQIRALLVFLNPQTPQPGTRNPDPKAGRAARGGDLGGEGEGGRGPEGRGREAPRDGRGGQG